MSEYPECNKLLAVRDQSQVIGEFLDWVADQKRACLMINLDGYGRYRLAPNKQDLLAEFFGIDLKKVEQEKLAILEEARVTHD